jgi:hypothetical protein
MNSPARKLGSTEQRPITVPHYHRVKESKPRLAVNNLLNFFFRFMKTARASLLLTPSDIDTKVLL